MTVKTLSYNEASSRIKLLHLDRNLFSSPSWVSVLQKTYNITIFVKYIERNGAVDSYILYSVVKNFLEWKICVLSYCDYCDCPVKSKEDWKLFFADLRREYPMSRIAVRNLRDETALACGCFQVLSRERFHLLDVREPVEAVWKKTHESFRSAVKQSQKAGAVVRRCDKAGLKKFFDLHLSLRKNKYRLFPQPYRFFDNIWQEYMEKDRGVLLGAFDSRGNFIGGNVYLICGDTLYYKFNTSSVTSLKLRPNNRLFWEGIKFAKERDLGYIDLGSSGIEQHGLIAFKNHTGAAMMDITHLGYAPPGYKFSQKRILRVMTSFFTQDWVPPGMVRFGSNIIYPYLA